MKLFKYEKKSTKEEIRQAILQVQPKRLFRKLQSILPEMAKTILNNMGKDPIETLTKLFFEIESENDREAIKTTIKILVFYGAETKKGIQFYNKHACAKYTKKHRRIINSGLDRILKHPLDPLDLVTLVEEKKQLQDFKKYVSFSKHHFIDSYSIFFDTLVNEKFNLKDLDTYIKNIHKFLILEDHSVQLFPYMAECACQNNIFNRLDNKRRENLEQEILTETAKCFPPGDFQLNCLSLGSGLFLQDFILISKLILNGYKNINYVIIEPKINKDALAQLKSLIQFAANNDLSLKIQHFRDIHDYFESVLIHVGFHVIHAIDFEDIENVFNDIILAHKLLLKDGKFFLSVHEYEFCFSYNQCLSNKLYHTKLETLAKSIEKEIPLPNQESVSFAALGFASIFEWSQIIPMLGKNIYKSLQLTLMHPQEKSSLGYISGKINEQFNEENVVYFLKLFLPVKELKIEFVSSLEDFETKLKLSKINYDILTMINYQTHPDKVNDTINWIKTNPYFSSTWRFCYFMGVDKIFTNTDDQLQSFETKKNPYLNKR